MSYAFRKARKLTGGAADIVSEAASSVHKVTGAAFDVIADTAKKVGKTVEQIAKDPKMLAALAISVAYPGAGAALGQALGLGSTTGAIIGNTLINTALNGGDLKKGLKSAVANYAGVVVGGMAAEVVKGGAAGSFLQSQSGLIDKAVNNAVSAAIKGKDPKAAIAGTIMNAAVAESTSTIPGFSNLPPAARTAISGSISQSLQGKSLDTKAIFADAATSALVGYGLSQIEGYKDLAPKYQNLAATSLAAAIKGKNLTENTINWALSEANRSLQQTIRDDKEAQAKEEGWKNYPEKVMAQQRGYTSAEDYHDSLNPKPAPEPEKQADKEETPAPTEADKQETPEAPSTDETPTNTDTQEEPTPKEEVETEIKDSETIKNLIPTDQETPTTPSVTPPAQEEPATQIKDPEAEAKTEGWSSLSEKDWASTLGYKDPTLYKQDMDAQASGWKNNEEKTQAEAQKITDPNEWKIAQEESQAKKEGWDSFEQKTFAEHLGFDSADKYNQHINDENARSFGFADAQDQANAKNAGYETIDEWKQFQRDESARYLGYDDEADQKKAEDAGFKDAKDWNASLNEDRIIQFFNDNVGRDPTPEELQEFATIFEPAKNADEFSDDQVKNLIYGSIDTSSYVYGPNGERYDSEADAVANGVYDFTDEWNGPVYGSDGNQYDSAADAIANGVFDFSGEKPEGFVEPTDTENVTEEAAPEVIHAGVVYGPDGTEYASVADAMADGVFDVTDTPPEVQEEPVAEEPTPTEPAPEEATPEEPAPEEPAPEEPAPEEPSTEETGPEEPAPEEPAPEEPLTCEPGFHDDGTGLCVPDEESDTQDEQVDCGVGFHLNADGVCESDDIPEENVCEPGFHDDGTGLCVADEDKAETDCGVGFHLNADGVCESDDTTGGETTGGSTGGGGSGSVSLPRRQQILQTLAKSALSSPAFQSQLEAPPAPVSAAPVQKASPLEQLGGKSIYPTRFRSVLQDYLAGIKPPEELSMEGAAPAPAELLNQPSTIEQYREPDMATSTYFNYGQAPDLTELARLQQEQDLPLGQGLAMAEGGMVAPLLMAKGGTGHGKNAHGALSIVEHSGKHRIDYRQGDAVTGAGDGQSDDIPAMLADGEFVIPADVVAALGNGSTKAGSDKLYEMMHSIREQHRAAKPKDLPPPAKKSPLDYLKKGK